MSMDPVEYYGKRVHIGTYGAVSKEVALLENLTRRAIIYFLATRGPLTLKELSESLKLAPSTIHDHIRKLKEAGFIEEASDFPKRFKVEVHYRLRIPFMLTSELNLVEKTLMPQFNYIRNSLDKASREIEETLRNTKLKCLEYLPENSKDRFLHTLSLALIVQASFKAILELVGKSLVYAMVNDLGENK